MLKVVLRDRLFVHVLDDRAELGRRRSRSGTRDSKATTRRPKPCACRATSPRPLGLRRRLRATRLNVKCERRRTTSAASKRTCRLEPTSSSFIVTDEKRTSFPKHRTSDRQVGRTGRIRTCYTSSRNAVLYQVSYRSRHPHERVTERRNPRSSTPRRNALPTTSIEGGGAPYGFPGLPVSSALIDPIDSRRIVPSHVGGGCLSLKMNDYENSPEGRPPGLFSCSLR